MLSIFFLLSEKSRLFLAGEGSNPPPPPWPSLIGDMSPKKLIFFYVLPKRTYFFMYYTLIKRLHETTATRF